MVLDIYCSHGFFFFKQPRKGKSILLFQIHSVHPPSSVHELSCTIFHCFFPLGGIHSETEFIHEEWSTARCQQASSLALFSASRTWAKLRENQINEVKSWGNKRKLYGPIHTLCQWLTFNVYLHLIGSLLPPGISSNDICHHCEVVRSLEVMFSIL